MKKVLNLNMFLVSYALLMLCSCVPPESTGSDVTQGFGGFITGTIYFILLGFFAYYFIVIKPAQLEEDNRKKFIDELKKNDQVKTTGGLIGRVSSIKSSVVNLEIAPKVIVKVDSSDIHQIPEDNSDSKSDKPDVKDKDKANSK